MLGAVTSLPHTDSLRGDWIAVLSPHLWGAPAAPVDNEEAHRSVDASQTVHNYRGIISGCGGP
jgi:hypothetical protein